jgi:DNA (cytosine-5)-methyltransferase 1
MPDNADSVPRLLDLFCGAGGAAMGYHRAGFEVVGVDLKPQPNYPFEFIQDDALLILSRLTEGRDIAGGGYVLGNFDAIHASPPCQAHSTLGSLWRDREHPDLVPQTRELLCATGLPYVIENVVGAPLHDPFLLCGSMFGLCANGRQLRRHRIFESNVFVMRPVCQHRGQPVGVYGHGGGGSMTRGYKGTAQEYREAMGIDWATRAEIAQAIPPAYCEHVGGFLLVEVNCAGARGSIRQQDSTDRAQHREADV